MLVCTVGQKSITRNSWHIIETATSIPPTNSESLCMLPVGDSTRTTGIIDCFSDLQISKTGNNSCILSESLSERTLQKQNTYLPPQIYSHWLKMLPILLSTSFHYQHSLLLFYWAPGFLSTHKLCNINPKRCKPFPNSYNSSIYSRKNYGSMQQL